jgi:4-methylaminobutanoate oxidase (formaldehyde-forming)
LQYICAGDLNVEPGKLVYTQWLNPQGGIEADVTVAKMADDVFFVTTGVASTYRDYWYLKKNLRGDVKLVDTTSKYACLSIQGPNSRAVLTEIAETDMSAEGFTFGTGRFAKVGGHEVWIQRLSYVGELGWEVFAPSEHAVAVFAEMQKAGASFEIANVGLHALNSLRMEKGFRHWGHDIGPADNMIQAGLGFAAKPDASDFIGRDAFVAAKATGVPDRRMLQFKLDDPEPLLYHNESIIMDGEIVGYLTSGMYGHAVGGALGMGYAEVSGLTADKIAEGKWEIEIATERFSAQAQLRAFYDPKGEKMRSSLFFNSS